LSKTYLTADCNFSHRKICKILPIASTVEDHDAIIFENIMSTVNKRDILWIVGDVCFDMKQWHYVETIANHVSGLRIVFGNHDLHGKGFPTIQDYMMLPNTKFFGAITYKDAWVTHMPIHESELRNKKINIHGHTHSAHIIDPRYVNVCLDVWDYHPIEYSKIIE
jgi:calcineurin-like phosphoesterase family protein